jgi:LTXXQ motif family protein
MLKLSRGAWIAIAAVAAVPATLAVAATAEKAGWHQMSPETRARLDEGRLAMVRAALKLTPDQEKLWTPIEAQVRATFKDREAKQAEHKAMREEMEKLRAEGKRPDMAERLDKMSQRMSERAEKLKTFSGAFKPFYAALSDEQKDVLRPLAHDLMPGMGGHRGHGGHRWAFGGGWGDHEGRGGHHGWGGGRHHGEHGERGGPMMDDSGSDNAPANSGQPAGEAPKPADKQ